MRVVNSARDGIHDTERQVIAALRAWDTPGIAVSGVRVGVAGGDSAEADLVVILPAVAMVLEVKGLREKVGGTLFCPVQGDWSHPRISGDPVHSQARGNPREQVERVMYGVKNLAEKHTGAPVFVDGLVVVVPWEGHPLTLDKGQIPMPPGQDVLLADPQLSAVRDWAEQRAHHTATWTAARVVAVLGALNFTPEARNPDRRVTRAELVLAGFPLGGTTAPSHAGVNLTRPAATAGSPPGTETDPDASTAQPGSDLEESADRDDDQDHREADPIEADTGSSGIDWPARPRRGWYDPAPPPPPLPEPPRYLAPATPAGPVPRQPLQALIAVALLFAMAVLTGKALTPTDAPDPVRSTPAAVTRATQPAAVTAPAIRRATIPPPCYPLQPQC